ncbi:RpiB/LacA/LacB family sugar-phosphate isomerase [Paenibacillus kribbensis]|uniref:RpiB/LacA/LacB family sugar-phosphate isomerase n=1 Tax=Paenibacillus kribbensis TaxID=172713 RepID=UPI000838CAF0|nr:RpiB/LacA/LacB family sugar-phosphate isomerase [Paenibacillus kribbensis]
MRISVGCDHIMIDLKQKVHSYLAQKGHEVIDQGTYNEERTHYPIYGKRAAGSVAKGESDLAVVVCGSGIGISIAANKVAGVRAVVASATDTVRYARRELNANVLGIGGMVVGWGVIQDMIDAFLDTSYVPTEKNRMCIAKLDAMIQDNGQTSDEHLFDDLLAKWERGEYHC